MSATLHLCSFLGDEAVASSLGPAPLDTPVAGLVIDPADVLYDESLWRRWLLQQLARVGLQTQYRSFYRVWECQYADAVYCGRQPFCDALAALLRDAGVPAGTTDEILAACRHRRFREADGLRAVPGAVETLHDLWHRGLSLALAANTELSAELLRQRLADMDLDRVFSVVVSSRDLECPLGEPRFLATVLRAMRLSADETAFVSRRDCLLQTAAATGMATIALCPDADTRADRAARCWAELPLLLRVRRALAAAG